MTGLIYDNTCVGVGGLRAVFSDGKFSHSFHTDVQQWIISTPGVVTNSDWKFFTIFYGPDNLAECLPGVDLEDGIRNCSEEGPYKLEV